MINSPHFLDSSGNPASNALSKVGRGTGWSLKRKLFSYMLLLVCLLLLVLVT